MRIAIGVVLALLPAASALGQTTFTVTTTDDAGSGSLRQAIEDANANPGADAIHFDIPGAGPHTIRPLSALPEVTDPVDIDGLTQPGADCDAWPATLAVELDGTDAGLSSPGLVLAEGAAGSLVRGLVINDFGSGSEPGITVQADDARIACNYIGTDVTGTAAEGNGEGILLDGAAGVRIGGAEAGARNLISGNEDGGILIEGDGASGAIIQGNFIGTDVHGTVALNAASGDLGIEVDGGEGGHQIGGTDHDSGVCNRACNLISGNEYEGIEIDDSATGSTIQGNFIGTDVTGMVALPNGRDGVYLDIDGNTVGGTEPGAGNLISANGQRGVVANSDGNVVQGNLIGTDVTGVGALGNGALGNPFFSYAGVEVDGSGNLVGGPSPEAANVIAFNDGSGIAVAGLQGGQYDGNAFRGNAIFANGVIGIDLGLDDEAVPNDPGDADEGPNRLQNAPELTSATGDGVGLTVEYAVPSSVANSAYPLTVEFFLAEDDGEEGRAFIGLAPYEAADAEQQASVTFSPAASVFDGDRVVATATDAEGNTSEFGAAVTVVGDAVSNEPGAEAPSGFALSAAYPNPFNPSTVLVLDVPQAGAVTVAVYDLLGREVARLHDGPLAAGTHTLRFDAVDLPSGVYVVRASGPVGTVSRRVTLVR